MSNKGTLFLIPSLIAEDSGESVLSGQARATLPHVRTFLAENVRSARRFLSSLRIYESIEVLKFSVLDKDTKPEDLAILCGPLLDGTDMGVITESGCPGVADPGAAAVEFAHQHGIRVVPLVGPSSVLLALMASGLNGQRFTFQGYLPIESKELSHMIRELERESRAKGLTQIFIETPYRNNALLGHLLRNLSAETRLCVAVDITGHAESIKMQKVVQWKTEKVDLPRKPAIFLFLA